MTVVHFMTNSQKILRVTKSDRKEREKRRRKESIIDAAEELIKIKGFDAVTMDEIAETAELSKGALYLYFENKLAIHLAITERGSQLLNRRFAEVLTRQITGLEMIREMGKTYLEFIQSHPIYSQSFIRYENIQDEAYLAENEYSIQCQEHSRQSLAYIGRALQVGMMDGTIDDSYEPQELAVLVWASARGVVMVSQLQARGESSTMFDGMKLSMESMIGSLLKLLENGMAKERDNDN